MKELLLAKGYVQGTKTTALFEEAFINMDGSLDIAFFNFVHDTTYTAKALRGALKELGVTPLYLGKGEESTKEISEMYTFGAHVNAKMWIIDLYNKFGKVFSRGSVLGWVARQRPEKSAGSFSPLGMAHIPSVNETEAI